MAGVLGKYQLDYRLGGGGMAEVFIAHTMGAEGFSRKVAIKRVLPGFSDNPQFAKMFVDEARISARLQHPNVVSVLDFDRDPEGRLFLVMEYIEGKDLDALMQTGLVPFPVAIFVTSEILRGLGYAHDLPITAGQPGTSDGMRGIVHRDVSPHNALLSWEGAVKVSDFGIAKARSASEATASEFIKGKPAYMSPEQANGERLDGRSDLFAVGVMLWEMLCGRRLFVGEDTRTTLAAVLFGTIPRPRALRPDVPKDLEKVVMKLLERDLPARYRTAELAIADLLECNDAPKSGREQLIRLMTERFPHDAPFRQSRSNPGLTPVPAHAAHAATIIAHHPQHQHAAGPPQPAASIGAMRSAKTGTLGPAGMSTGKKIALGLLVAAVAGGATFGIVATMKSKTGANDGGSGSDVAMASGAQPGPPADAAAATPPPPIDAAPEATVPVDAAPAVVVDAAPAVDARSGSGEVRPAVKKYGYLEVITNPILTATLDDGRVRDTPIRNPPWKVTVGKHTVKFSNGEKRSVLIQEGKTEKIEILK
ncbi:MAG: serine/threonine protein kinase [Kofleriaceae bacterium]